MPANNHLEPTIDQLLETASTDLTKDLIALVTRVNPNKNDMRDQKQLKTLIKEGALVNEVYQHGLTPLLLALKYGTSESARILLKNGARVNVRSNGDETPLQLAVLKYPFMIEELIERGANVNEVYEGGYTPLLLALKQYHPAAARKLIDAGANLNVKSDFEGETPLQIVARGGASSWLIQQLIERGVNVNEVFEDGTTPLFMALQHNNGSAAWHLLEAGIDANSRNHLGMSALHIALQSCPDMVKHLIRHGADTTEKYETGSTALLLALRNGFVDASRAVIKAGMDVNAMNDVGETPLYIAAKYCEVLVPNLIENGAIMSHEVLLVALEQGHAIAAVALIRAGADVSTRSCGRSTLMLAAERCEHAVTELIARGACIDEADQHGWTPLMLALKHDHVVAAKALLDAGVNASAKTNCGQTALKLVIEKRLDLVTDLIDKGSNINEEYEDGTTPFLLAVQNGNTVAVRALVEAGANTTKNIPRSLSLLFAVKNCPDAVASLIYSGANVNEQDEDGYTPLHVALRKGQFDSAIALINAGADVKAKTIYGETCLRFASETCEDIIEELVCRGADVNEVYPDQRTPLLVALENGKTAAANYLLDAGAIINVHNEEHKTPLQYAVKSSPSSVPKLIARGANINEVYKNELTPLLLALKHGNAEASEALISVGATLNTRTKKGNTALILAAENCPSMVERLIREGQDVNAQNENGFTPLLKAVKIGDEYAARKLINSYANINAKTKYGDTVLHFAVKYCVEDIVFDLVEAGAYVHEANRDGDKPLLLALYNFKYDSAEFLAEAGFFGVDTEDAAQYLEYAFRCGILEIECALISHILLLDREIELSLPLCADVLRFWEHCKSEVEEMQNYMLGSSGTSLRRFLLMSDRNRLAEFLSSGIIDMRAELQKLVAADKFPSYQVLIKSRIFLGEKRKRLLRKSEIFMNYLESRKIVKTLPTIVRYIVTDYLSNAELEILAKAMYM